MSYLIVVLYQAADGCHVSVGSISGKELRQRMMELRRKVRRRKLNLWRMKTRRWKGGIRRRDGR